jgi:prephenate dehydrogenase
MKINIAGGRGLMGQIHKPILENKGHEIIISGRTSNPGLEKAAEISDLTIVSVPIHATEQTIEKVAPYCSAIMDFTSLKTNPINEMLKYSPENCEVAGLHPLYGNVKSIKGRTVIYCQTQKTGEKCNQIIDDLKNEGAIIKKMDPEYHDSVVLGIAQNQRVLLLNAFGKLIERTGLSFKEFYEISPPPTQIMLDLLARQSDKGNDEMYKLMRTQNPTQKEVDNWLKQNLESGIENNLTPEDIRAIYGQELIYHQKKAKKLIDNYPGNN